jgi:hypothetical protein
MEMARVIVFTGQMDAMCRFYGDVLGLQKITEEKGSKEFAAGGVNVALHSGPSSPGRKGPKIVFYAKDVAAARDALVGRGRSLGRFGRGKCFAFATGRIQTEIRFSVRTGKLELRRGNRFPKGQKVGRLADGACTFRRLYWLVGLMDSPTWLVETTRSPRNRCMRKAQMES